MLRTLCLLMTLALALLTVSCAGGSSAARQVAADTTVPAAKTANYYVTVPESTAITVTLVDSIDTDVQLTGGTFRAEILEPMVVRGYTLFAAGAPARGVLSKIVESGRLNTPAELQFSLTAIQDGYGNWIDVGTNTIIEKKASHLNRNIAMVGGGAVVGGIIGAIIDKKGSTEIGAATGAAVGAGAAAATGKQDIFHGAGTEVVFFSSHSMRIASDNSFPRQTSATTTIPIKQVTTIPVTNATTAGARYVTVPESTAIAVTLVDSVDTDVQVTGATFRAELSKPLVVQGYTLFATGAAARGVLTKVVESGRLKTPAEMEFSLTAIQDGSGAWIDVATNTIIEKKASHTGREVAMIGGGAVVGGIIGAIIDKKGSTAIGAAAGAAVGTGAAAATGKQDIFHSAGTEVVFFSSHSMRIASDNSIPRQASGTSAIPMNTATTTPVTNSATIIPLTSATTAAARYVTMPESTAIAVTLVDSIDTDVQLTGALFSAELSEPLVVQGYTLFAAGAAARGVLTKVVESGRLKTPAELEFSLTAIQDGSGAWIDVGTDTIIEKKASHTNREVAMIGGGAVVGGIIGAIIDKKGSTAIGAATGAAVGTGAAAATGKQDIFHGAGSRIIFFSSQSNQIALK